MASIGRITVGLVAVATLAGGSTTLLAPSRAAAQATTDGRSFDSVFGDGDRWVPSLSVTMGFAFHGQEGTVASQEIGGTSPVRPPADNEQIARSPIGGGRLGLLTPSLPIPLVRPRLFFEGEIQAVSNQKRRIAREGNPTGIEEPETPDGNYTENTILGLGSITTADVDNVQYGAGVGLFFPFEIGDWRFALKPGARYLHRRMTFDGRVLAANRPNPAGPTQRIVLLGNDDLDVDAVGPALELEIDVARWWDVVGASVFIGGGAYRILGDRDVVFFGNATAPDPQTSTPENFQAQWQADLDPWIYHASLGMRLRWQGFTPGWLGLGD